MTVPADVFYAALELGGRGRIHPPRTGVVRCAAFTQLGLGSCGGGGGARANTLTTDRVGQHLENVLTGERLHKPSPQVLSRAVVQDLGAPRRSLSGRRKKRRSTQLAQEHGFSEGRRGTRWITRGGGGEREGEKKAAGREKR